MRLCGGSKHREITGILYKKSYKRFCAPHSLKVTITKCGVFYHSYTTLFLIPTAFPCGRDETIPAYVPPLDALCLRRISFGVHQKPPLTLHVLQQFMAIYSFGEVVARWACHE